MASRPQSAQALKQAAASLIHAIDPVAWAADCLDFICDGWQADFLRSTDQQTCLVCSRRSGKSASTAVLAAHTAVHNPGSLTLIVCPSQRQSGEMLRTVKGFLLRPKVNVKLEQNAATSLELSNGSRVVSIPASPEGIRGLTPNLIIMDECQSIPNDTDEALRPMMALSRNTRMIKLGTPAGCLGNFYDAAHSPNWKVIKINAFQCPRIDKDWLEAELYEKGQLYYDREFMCIFSSSEFSFFGSDMISAAFDCEAEPLNLPIFT